VVVEEARVSNRLEAALAEPQARQEPAAVLAWHPVSPVLARRPRVEGSRTERLTKVELGWEPQSGSVVVAAAVLMAAAGMAAAVVRARLQHRLRTRQKASTRLVRPP